MEQDGYQVHHQLTLLEVVIVVLDLSLQKEAVLVGLVPWMVEMVEVAIVLDGLELMVDQELNLHKIQGYQILLNMAILAEMVHFTLVAADGGGAAGENAQHRFHK